MDWTVPSHCNQLVVHGLLLLPTCGCPVWLHHRHWPWNKNALLCRSEWSLCQCSYILVRDPGLLAVSVLPRPCLSQVPPPTMAPEPLQPFLSFRKYPAISSSEQRQSYKNDFNAEYSEYRSLHARIEQITRRFTQLDAQLRQLSQGSEEYEVCQPPRAGSDPRTGFAQESGFWDDHFPFPSVASSVCLPPSCPLLSWSNR